MNPQKPEADNELQADPAHPAAIQGSDSGRAQDEAAGEASEAKDHSQK